MAEEKLKLDDHKLESFLLYLLKQLKYLKKKGKNFLVSFNFYGFKFEFEFGPNSTNSVSNLKFDTKFEFVEFDIDVTEYRIFCPQYSGPNSPSLVTIHSTQLLPQKIEKRCS